MSYTPIYSSGIECYHKLGGKYPLLVGENIEGDTIETLQEWNNHPNKYEIMADAMKFKKYLRTLKEGFLLSRLMLTREIGRIGNQINTPLYNAENIQPYIDCYIESIENIHPQVYEQLKNVKFSSNVFCHNALYYKSFVLKNNKLIGIRNWQYAGFYPPEFEDILQRYLEFI